MIIWIATASDALSSYDITAVGTTEAEAIQKCKNAVRKARRLANFPPYEYMDDITAVSMEVGKAYYDAGRGGEV